MKNQPLIVLVAIVTLTTGCASNLAGDSYSRSEARQVQQVEYGTIEQLRPVNIEGTKTPIGSGAGTLIGGIAGSNVGGHTASQVLAVIGAVAGGLVGAAVEEGVTRTKGVEITLTLQGGKTIAVVQSLSPNEKLAVGDRVRVISNGRKTRVSR
ncbi:MAG: hypothetical protein V3V12_05710 [Gammaproteobacteria bacterium]